MDSPRENASIAFDLEKEKPHRIRGCNQKSYVVLKKSVVMIICL